LDQVEHRQKQGNYSARFVADRAAVYTVSSWLEQR
jgi:hypothetical protein